MKGFCQAKQYLSTEPHEGRLWEIFCWSQKLFVGHSLLNDLLRLLDFESDLLDGVHAYGKRPRSHASGEGLIDALEITLVCFAGQNALLLIDA